MTISLFRKFLSLLCFAFVQGLILNKLNIMGYATPLVALFFLFDFRRGYNRALLVGWGFLLGIILDLFADSPGVGAASCTLLAFCQPLLLDLFCSKEKAEDLVPSMKTLGVSRYCWYLLSGTFGFHVVYYFLQVFSLTHPEYLMLNILGGTLFTFVLMLGVNSFYRRSML